MENNITGDSMFIKLSLVIFFFFFLILALPSTLTIKLNLSCDKFFLNVKKMNDFENIIKFKLFSFLPIYNKDLFKNKNTKNKKKKSNNKIKKVFSQKETIFGILRKSYINKLTLSLGFNVDDPIANSYINATLNTVICMYINVNQEKFNLKRLYYQTYVGDNLLNLNAECIIRLSLADTMKVIIKEYFKLIKNNEFKILQFKKRRDLYDRTSD